MHLSRHDNFLCGISEHFVWRSSVTRIRLWMIYRSNALGLFGSSGLPPRAPVGRVLRIMKSPQNSSLAKIFQKVKENRSGSTQLHHLVIEKYQLCCTMGFVIGLYITPVGCLKLKSIALRRKIFLKIFFRDVARSVCNKNSGRWSSNPLGFYFSRCVGHVGPSKCSTTAHTLNPSGFYF